MAVTKEELVEYRNSKIENLQKLEEWNHEAVKNIEGEVQKFRVQLNLAHGHDYELKKSVAEAEIKVLDKLIDMADANDQTSQNLN